MCGICGLIDFNGRYEDKDIVSMISVLNHRGPDNQSVLNYQLNNCKCGLGHARLSIIDLTEGANQPMEFESLSIVFNGEIYNYKEIRKDLESLNHIFTLNSDTEVILHAYKEWGISCVDKFIGMFAFTILDKGANKLVCCRDRAGIKPFYYYWVENVFMFASELKALYKHPAFCKQIDLSAVDLYMRYGYIPAPYSIYENCFKLLPGHILELDLSSKNLNIIKYWDIKDFYSLPTHDIPYDEAKHHLHSIFKSAFEYRMVADVPVGIFLSGGFDSALVTSVLQCNRTERLKTFTIGFETGNNEAPAAKSIASFLGTDHTEYLCTSKEAMDIIPTLPYYYDEPFADSSAIPTILVSTIARKDVTVALSADGGDEIFAGYNSYASFDRNIKMLKKIPKSLLRTTSSILNIVDRFYPRSCQFQKLKLNAVRNILHEPKEYWPIKLLEAAFKPTLSYAGKQFIKDFISHRTIFDDNFSPITTDLSVALCVDYKNYMQNDILVKVDRATMSVSLEGREPLLDHRIAEFAAQLPVSYKFCNGVQKRILKDIVYDYIPKELMDRPKTGFSVPVYNWLLNDLKYFLDEFLNPVIVRQANVFTVEYVNHTIKLFISNKLYDKTEIWKLLQFHMWYKQWN